MTDNELIEMAAKAAGLGAPVAHDKHAGLCFKWGEGFWNPLSDNGDAFELAVELQLNVFHAASSAYAMPSDDDGEFEEKVRYADAGSDWCAATRRAIVRAAAAMAARDAE